MPFARGRRSALSTVLFLLPLLSCTGDTGVGTEREAPQSARLAVVPVFPESGASAVADPVTTIRVRTTLVPGGRVVAEQLFTVDPNDEEWTIDVEVPLSDDPSVQYLVLFELLNEAGVAQWSGQLGPMTLRPGGTTVSRSLNVVRGPPANLSVVDLAVTGPGSVFQGETFELSARVETVDASSNPTVFWTSLTPEITSIDDQGRGRGLSPGSGRIQVESGSQSRVHDIEVIGVPVDVVIDPPSAVLTELGEEVRFIASVVDSRGASTGDPVVFGVADPRVLENLGDGRFRAIGGGETVVTATAVGEPSLSAEATVTVELAPVEIFVDPDLVELVFVGETELLEVTGIDAQGGRIFGIDADWSSSDEEVATVDDSGVVRAEGPGQAVITADVADGSGSTGGSASSRRALIATATIVVTPLVDRVTIDPPEAELFELGAQQQFTAEAPDAGGTPVAGAQLTYTSSRELTATVDQNGLATVVGGGETEITVESDGRSATAVLTVTLPVDHVLVDPPSADLFVGQEQRFVATAFDDEGNEIPGIEFEWDSSNPETLIAFNDGLTRASREGEADVTATTPTGVSGMAHVTVSRGSGDPVAVRFVTQPPSSARENEALAPPIQVEVIDDNGIRVTGAGGDIELFLTGGSGQAILGGNSLRPVTSGVATFDDLTVNQIGSGYQLSANTHPSPLQGALSSPFDIVPGGGGSVADLDVQKSVDLSSAAEGALVTFTVTLTNLGPAQAASPLVQDILPAGVTYVSHTATLGNYDNSSGFWGMAVLDVGAPQTLDIVARIDLGTAGQSITNNATLVGSESTDPNSSNDSGSATVTVTQPQQTTLVFGTAGNTQLRTINHSSNVTTPVVTEPTVNLVSGQTGSPTVLTTGTFSTTLLGVVNVEANGEFLYTPPLATTGQTDDFQVSLSNGETVEAQIQLTELVWFVDNTQIDGSGQSNSPFATLAGAEAAHGPGDHIFVHTGSGTTGLDTGIALQGGARLHGEGFGLNIFPFGQLVNPGTPPQITHSTSAAVLLPGFSAATEVRGLDIVNPGAFGIQGVNVSGATISDVTIDASVNDGLSLSNPSGTISIESVTITDSETTGLEINGGNADIQIINTNISTTGGPITSRPLDISGTTGGSVTFSSGSIVSNGSTGFVILNTNDGSVDIQAPISGSPVLSGITASFNNGPTTLNSINISTTNADALFVQGNTGAFTVNGGTLTAETGQALFVDGNASIDITLAGVTTTATGFSNDPAIELTNNSGTTTLAGLDIQRMLDGASAILMDNTGDVVVSGPGNRVNAFAGLGAGGAGVEVRSTSGQMVFESIDVSQGPSGIILDGFQGGLGSSFDLTGTGTPGSGGTIQNSTLDGVSVLNSENVSLTDLDIDGSGNRGIYAELVDQLSLTRLSLDGNQNEGIWLNRPLSGVTLDQVTVQNTVDDNLRIDNSVGEAPSIFIDQSVFATAQGLGDGALVVINGDAVVDFNNTAFTNNGGDGLSIAVGGGNGSVLLRGLSTITGGSRGVYLNNQVAGGGRTFALTVDNNTFLNQNSDAIRIDDFAGAGSFVDVTVQNNTITGPALNGVTLSLRNPIGGVSDILLDGNTISGLGTLNRGIAGFIGIGTGNAPDVDLTITNNVVAELSTFIHGISLEASNSAVVCMNIQGNDSGPNAGIQILQSSATAVMNLERLNGGSGTEASNTAIEAFVLGENTLSAAVSVGLSTVFNGVPDLTCVVP